MKHTDFKALSSGGSQQTAVDMLELLTLLAWLSHCRAERGEYLHAQQYLSEAVDQLLRMLRRFAADDGFAKVCLAVPRRRLASIAPALSRELLAVLLGAVPTPEAWLLEIVERRLRSRLPGLDWDELVQVRKRIQDAGTIPASPRDGRGLDASVLRRHHPGADQRPRARDEDVPPQRL